MPVNNEKLVETATNSTSRIEAILEVGDNSVVVGLGAGGQFITNILNSFER